jgi:hypothetical protein
MPRLFRKMRRFFALSCKKIQIKRAEPLPKAQWILNVYSLTPKDLQ